MATEPVPAKHHQPLHNFSLPFLKWGQRLQINNHCRRNRNRNTNNNNNNTGNSSSDSDHNPSTKPHRSRTDLAKTKTDEQNGDVYLEKRNDKVSDADVVTAVDGDVKPWNLRPRRFSITGDGNGNGNGTAGSSVKSRRLMRGVGDGDGVGVAAEEKEKEEDRKKKRRLWISLSKEEIEEDIYAFTGSKPARRPKKRNRTVQKLLDVCYVITFFNFLISDF